jgi:hypothetical protein
LVGYITKLIFGNFYMTVEKLQVGLKYDKNIRYFT